MFDDKTKWQDFRDLYKMLIYDIENIPIAKRMYYLKYCLFDEEAEFIGKIKIIAKGYSTT